MTSFVSSFLRCLRAPRMLSLILQILFVLAYLVFSAMPISAVRAAIMAIASSLSYTAKRKSAPLNALGLCIIALVATSPSAAVSVSFALSAGSTLGIILVSPLILSWFEPLKFPIPRFVKDALALTLAANIATLPASAALFSQASLIAPLANVVCSPLFALVCSVGLLASIFGSLPGLGCVISFVAELSSSAINTIVSMLAHVPFASIVVNAPVLPMIITSVLLTWLLWYFWPRASLGKFFACAGSFALAFCVWAALCPYAAGTCIVMLDVGQGDAFLIRSGGKTLLIDTGNKDQALKQALARQGIFKFDAILITHADDDHCGSLSSLRGVVEIDSVLVARDALSCSCSSCANLRESAYAVVDAQKCTGLMPGNTLSFGNVSLEVVWPYAFQEEGGNADSLCVLARFGNLNSANSNEKFVTALFCGDAESEQINEMQERGSVGEVDIYKVGHHGSRAALDDKAAKNLSARIALVSVGANNRYGHPSQETLERLESQGAHVFRSDEQGDVSCKIEGTSISVTTLR